MTTFTFTSANIAQTSGAGEHAFSSDTAAPDTLVVAQGGGLSATGDDAFGALLGNAGAWTVKVNGTVRSDKSHGIVLAQDNAEASAIAVGATGIVQGLKSGLNLWSTSSVANSGQIQAGGTGVEIVDASAHKITNKGTIAGGAYSIRDLGGSSIDTVVNSGTLNGNVNLAGGSDALTNSGAVNGNVVMGAGDDVVKNASAISGYVSLGIGHDRLSNSGTIGGSVYALEGDDRVINSGHIGESVVLGGGNDTSEANVLNNSGTIVGNVFGGSGKDSVTNTGVIKGWVDLGMGDDTYAGGAKADRVKDGAGSDKVNLGGGNDAYIATRTQGIDGADTINAGDGIDQYDASAALTDVQINLGTVARDFSPLAPGVNLVYANTATGGDVAGLFEDSIFNFENAIGGRGNDVIYGSDAANELEAGAGDDFLAGYGGADRLFGGNGQDLLFGGAGKDFMSGGADEDVFLFTRLLDSGVTGATRDVIADFAHGDKIDLSLIDAVAGNGAINDAFNFIGTDVSFSGVAGQLHARTASAGLVVEADVNGDGVADFSILVADATHTLTLTSLDFVL